MKLNILRLFRIILDIITDIKFLQEKGRKIYSKSFFRR